MDINDLLKLKENTTLEVKKAKEGLPKSLWESYSAFANTDGGTILLGITEDDDKNFIVTGITNPDSLLKEFWDTLNNRSKVSVNLLQNSNVTIHEIENRTIIQIYVPKAARVYKPVYLNNDLDQTYLRNGEGDYKASKESITMMIKDSGQISNDERIIEYLTINKLSKETIQTYRKDFKQNKDSHVWNELTDEEFLERIGALKINEKTGKLNVTLAGLIMFGEEYLIVNEIPNYFLEYKKALINDERWSDRIITGDGSWSGNIYDFYKLIFPKLCLNVEKPFMLEGVKRVDDTPLIKALREAFINMLSNADYNGRYGVKVTVTDKEILFENPGDIRVGKEQMKKGGLSDPRNLLIMKFFNLLGIGEKAGSGVPMIIKACEDGGYNFPIIKYDQEWTRTTVGFSLIKASDSFIFDKDQYKDYIEMLSKDYNLRKSSIDVLIAMKEKNGITPNEIATRLNKDLSSIYRSMKTLSQKGIITKDHKTKKWIINL